MPTARTKPTLPNPSEPLSGPTPWWLLSLYALGVGVVIFALAYLIVSG